jgi:hypothetical protein
MKELRNLVMTVTLALGGLSVAACGDSSSTPEIDAGAPDAAPLITRQEVMHGCLRSDGCNVQPYGYLSYCITNHYDETFTTGQSQIWSDLYRCVNDAGGDCPSIRKCYGGGEEPVGCTSLSDGFCDGDTKVECDTMDRKLYRYDCTASSLECSIGSVAGDQQAPFCGLGPCEAASYPPQCDGDLLLTCDNGYINIRDCWAQGLTCGGQDTSIGCVGRGPACEPTVAPTCEGDVLTKCHGGTLARIDCSSLPGRLTCRDGSENCVPAGEECTPGVEECDGTRAKICLDGYWSTADCVELGFRRCEVEGGAGVHCRL